MNRRQVRFVAEYFAANKSRAGEIYARVYGIDTSTVEGSAVASAGATRLLDDVEIIEEIKKWEFQMSKGLRLTTEDFHKELARVAMADARDIMGYYIGACRYCYGDHFRYQRTPAEFERDMDEHIARQLRMKDPDPLGLRFKVQGGIGFNPKKMARPDCPECYGIGIGYSVIHDTRYLNPGAARIFDGIKQTKDGFEVKLRSRDKMIIAAGQALGLLNIKPVDQSDDGQKVIVEGGLPDEPEHMGPPRQGEIEHVR